MKTRTSTLMPVLAALALTAGCSDLQDDAMLTQAAATETAYVNGRIYTQDEDRPWAESLVTKGDRIVFVGSDEEALEHAAEDARLVDLQNRFVMPGMVDAHTHPGLIATGANLSVLDETDEADEGPANADRMPSRPREATLAWLQRYADDHPFTLVIRQGVWDVATYLPHGPHKRDLDDISRLRPIMLNDNSGHSVWVNSAFLRLFGIDADTPDLSRNLSHFVRDENGEPTGWVKEFSLLPYFGDRFVPDADELKERLLKYLNYMSSRGITTLWDARQLQHGRCRVPGRARYRERRQFAVALGGVAPHLGAGADRDRSGIAGPAEGEIRPREAAVQQYQDSLRRPAGHPYRRHAGTLRHRPRQLRRRVVHH